MRAAGEGWADGLRKMVAVHEVDGELGVIYLDLFPRSGLFSFAMACHSLTRKRCMRIVL